MTASDPGGEGRTRWRIRPARPSDVEAMALLDLELFPDEAWTVDQIAGEMTHPTRRYGVIDAPDQPLLGYTGVMLLGEMADLQTIGSRRPGQGIGRALLAWAEDQARRGGAERMLLEVREDNHRARTLYSRSGYTEIGRRRGYYRTATGPVDALVMERRLVP